MVWINDLAMAFFFLLVGVATLLAGQAFVNVGVALGLLPTTGVTLPFVSYGGSALLTVMGAVGILVNVARQGVPRTRRR